MLFTVHGLHPQQSATMDRSTAMQGVINRMGSYATIHPCPPPPTVRPCQTSPPPHRPHHSHRSSEMFVLHAQCAAHRLLPLVIHARREIHAFKPMLLACWTMFVLHASVLALSDGLTWTVVWFPFLLYFGLLSVEFGLIVVCGAVCTRGTCLASILTAFVTVAYPLAWISVMLVFM